jgi:hypothetical protein
MTLSALNALSAVLSALGSLIAALAFGKLLGSKAGRDEVISEARAEERAKLARRAWQEHRALSSARIVSRKRDPAGQA